MRSVLARRNLTIVRRDPSEYFHALRARVLGDLGVDLVLDVGANNGQYAGRLRQEGYGGQINSFEPTAGAFKHLASAAANDPAWQPVKLALSDFNGELTLREFGSSLYNSGLPFVADPEIRRIAPPLVASTQVAARRLDSLKGDMWHPTDSIALKIDVQGLELPVLLGASAVLESTAVVELELSTLPMYEGQALISELMEHLYARGFALIGVRPIFSVAGYYMAQADGLFVRRDHHPKLP